jgi:hypothetical protein
MLDKPEKTQELVAALKAAVPFKVALAPKLIAHLRAQPGGRELQPTQTVHKVLYGGDEAGILCQIEPVDGRGGLVASITHLHVPRSLPCASAVLDYQKHRIKKLKKQHGADWNALQSVRS